MRGCFPSKVDHSGSGGGVAGVVDGASCRKERKNAGRLVSVAALRGGVYVPLGCTTMQQSSNIPFYKANCGYLGKTNGENCFKKTF